MNEFVAYAKLGELEGEISERSKTIATYALCGFSNPISIGIQISGFSTLAPTRRQDLHASLSGRTLQDQWLVFSLPVWLGH